MLKTINNTEELRKNIAEYEHELNSFCNQAYSFYKELQAEKLITNIIHRKKPITYKNAPQFTSAYIPEISWITYETVDGKSKRIYLEDWEAVSKLLDAGNATLPERIFHMKVNIAMREIYSTSRNIAEKLRQAYNLLHNVNHMLETEEMTEQDFIKFQSL